MAGSKGRCSGCGQVDDLPRTRQHIVSCPDWAALYQRASAQALTPEDEFDRWVRDERDGERAAVRVQAMADTDDRKALSVARFKVPDPLED